MIRNTPRPWAARVPNLIDPFSGQQLSARLDEGFFQHVLDRHSAQPLGELFGQPEYVCLNRGLTPDNLVDAGKHFARELRCGLAEGLTLAFDSRDARGQLTTTYLVVLPCGAMAAMRLGRELSPRTVYYTNRSLVRHSREARRAATAAALINRFALRSFSQGAIVPPPASFVRHVRNRQTGRVQVRTNVRFNDLERWGFCPALQGCPYRGRPDVRFDL